MKLPGPLVEWRAARIEDPVERLRYLRKAAPRVGRKLPVRGFRNLRWHSVVPAALGAVLFVGLLGPSGTPSRAGTRTQAAAARSEQAPPSVWMIEENPGYEVYSNGLRIDKEFVTANRARGSYAVYQRSAPAETEAVEMRTQPSGIVFHSTESHQAPLRADETRNLKRIGRALLDYVRQQHAYHYVIDRFGRVYRIVQESDDAFHAGRSAWADERYAFVNLNDGFLGVAFEAQTSAETPLSAAQIHSGRVLTDMLRSKYAIRAADCATHAQVSVNTDNWKLGYHTDWASGFPWQQFGLPDNYAAPVAALFAFGFTFDDLFLEAAGKRRWPGLDASLNQVREQAAAAGIPEADYRKRLQRRFQTILNSAANRERGD